MFVDCLCTNETPRFHIIRLCSGHMRTHAWYYKSDQNPMAGRVIGNEQKILTTVV